MIIERKYVGFGIIYDCDPLAREVIKKAFSAYPDEDLYRFIEGLYELPVAQFDFDTAVPGDIYQTLLREFAKLDESSPYDNGYTFRDVDSVVSDSSRKGTAIKLTLYHGGKHMYDTYIPREIIGFITVENKDGHFTLIDKWD